METVEFNCNLCGKISYRRKKWHEKSLLNNKPMYCSRECSGKANQDNLGKYFGNSLCTKPSNEQEEEILLLKRYITLVKNRRKWECTLKIEELIDIWKKQEGRCAYTNIPLDLPKLSQKTNDIRITASLDRIDSTKGYVKNNVQFVSICINFMKSTLTDIQTKEFINMIIKNAPSFRKELTWEGLRRTRQPFS